MNRVQAFRTLGIGSALIACSFAAEAQNRPPWPAGDEIGMANTLGPATWQRCATQLANPKAKSYELSFLRSNTMPQSPFAVPLRENAKPTVGIQGTRHAFNADEVVGGDPGQQGTQMDALGHFAVLPQPWDGKSEFPSGGATYYGGHKQNDVKPTPDSPLKKLGIDKVPPIVTTAVLLDAKAHLGRGNAMQPGQLVTAADIEAMLKAQGLEGRGLVAGDVLYIYTGWGDNWKDPDTEKFYYTKGPGLAYDAAKYIEQKAVVLVALDNPFTDPVAEGFLQGKAPPAAGTPEGLPFAIHHHNLTVAGIHNIQNANLGDMARDKVWLSCTIILPLRTQGASGSPVRPVAIGAPAQYAVASKEDAMLKYIALAAAFISLGIVGSLNAQQQTTPAPLPAIKRTPLQKVEVPGSNYEVVFGIAEFVPNVKAGRHSHPGTVLAYVMEGEFFMAPDGQPEKTYKAGESLQVPDRAIHNEGTADKPAKVMAVYVVEKGKPLVQPAQ